MTKKLAIHYIDNKKFQQEMIDYIFQVRYAKENELPEPRIPEYIGECFYKIATKLSYSPQFRNYPFIEDMIADGYETCILYIKNYDAARGNPFAYFTQFVWNAFILRIKKEKKHHYIKFKSLERAMIDNDLSSFQGDDESINYASTVNNDYMNGIISSFEDDVRKRKDKAREAKEEKKRNAEEGI